MCNSQVRLWLRFALALRLRFFQSEFSHAWSLFGASAEALLPATFITFANAVGAVPLRRNGKRGGCGCAAARGACGVGSSSSSGCGGCASGARSSGAAWPKSDHPPPLLATSSPHWPARFPSVGLAVASSAIARASSAAAAAARARGGPEQVAGLPGGDKGYRNALPHAQIQTVAPRLNRTAGHATVMMGKAIELHWHRCAYALALSMATDKTVEEMIEFTGRSRTFTPEKAVEFGLIDRVLETKEAFMEAKNYEEIAQQSGILSKMSRGPPGSEDEGPVAGSA